VPTRTVPAITRGLGIHSGLAASVRNNQLRRTTVKVVLEAGGRLVPTYDDEGPPNHCDLFGLTAEKLDSILSASEPNPVPKEERWRGAPR